MNKLLMRRLSGFRAKYKELGTRSWGLERIGEHGWVGMVGDEHDGHISHQLEEHG